MTNLNASQELGKKENEKDKKNIPSQLFHNVILDKKISPLFYFREGRYILKLSYNGVIL